MLFKLPVIHKKFSSLKVVALIYNLRYLKIMQGWNIFLVVSPYPRLLSEWTILCWNFFGAQNTERTPVARTSGFQFHFRFHYLELQNIVYIIIAVATKSYEYFNWWLWCWNLGEASTLDIYIIYTLDCGYSSELQSLQLRSILDLRTA